MARYVRERFPVLVPYRPVFPVPTFTARRANTRSCSSSASIYLPNKYTPRGKSINVSGLLCIFLLFSSCFFICSCFIFFSPFFLFPLSRTARDHLVFVWFPTASSQYFCTFCILGTNEVHFGWATSPPVLILSVFCDRPYFFSFAIFLFLLAQLCLVLTTL